ncbi:MAG: glycosyltransferase [Verrucomicrobiota bacterium]
MSATTRAHHYVVIPAFNEARRLPGFLKALGDALSVSGLRTTVQVVDDGSTSLERDAMARAVESVRLNHVFVLPLVSLPSNCGKGAAIRSGWSVAPPEADWLCFVDADGAISPSEVTRVLMEIDAGMPVDAWFSSRICMLGRKIERSWSRHVVGRAFASMVGVWIDGDVYDSQCGFKGVRASAWAGIQGKMCEDGFAFDVELLAALRERRADVRELPIDWADQAGSKVSVLRDGWRMACAVRRIRRRFALSG